MKKPINLVTRNYFEFQYVIGRGGFSKVWQVIMKKNNKKYALKEMSKVKIIDRRSEKSIKGEREFLSKLHHPFIVNMICAFQDYETLYLVMDLLTGGDLRYHLCNSQKFNEIQTKFFISCVILGLEYIHGNNIIHRDIKPENLVCDENGYIRITDFGVAKIRKEDNSSETSGTPGYMAPEVLLGQNHSFPVDFFAIGVMGYEFMFGERPYAGRSRKEIKHAILKQQAKIDNEDIPNDWSFESVDFINKCLRRKYSKRLGYENGVYELKEHEWFKDYNWEKLYNKTIKAPFRPNKGGNYDKKYCEHIDKITETTFYRYQSYINQSNFGRIFLGYTFINYDLIQNSFGVETNTRNTTNSKQSKFQNTVNITNNNYNDKKLLIQNNNNSNNNINNILNHKNKFDNNNNSSSKDKEINTFINKYLSNRKEKITQIIEKEKNRENSKEKLKNKDNEIISFNSNSIKTPQYQNNKRIILEKNDSHFQLKFVQDKKNNINLVSNNSNNNNNNINYIKKRNSINENENIKLRSTSVDISLSNMNNNLSHRMNYIKQINKQLNLNYANVNSNNNNEQYKYINGSLSNPNRDKYTYKLKSNIGLGSSMIAKKNNNNNIKREMSSLYNNHLHKNHNNYIQLRRFNNDGKDELPFYLPNLNKNMSKMNFNEIKKKQKINLNQLKYKLNLNNILKNDTINNKNKYILSPNNRRLRKSESLSLMKNTVNSSSGRLYYNVNKNKNNYNNNFFSHQLKRNFSYLSNKESNIRNLYSARKKNI